VTETPYTVVLSEPHKLTEGDETEIEVAAYDDLGSMIHLELPDGTRRSVGKQLVEEVVEGEGE